MQLTVVGATETDVHCGRFDRLFGNRDGSAVNTIHSNKATALFVLILLPNHNILNLMPFYFITFFVVFMSYFFSERTHYILNLKNSH